MFEIFKVAIPNFIDDSISCILAMYINLFLIILLGEVGLVLYAVLIKIRNLLRVHIKVWVGD